MHSHTYQARTKNPKLAALPLHTFFFVCLFSSEAEGLRSAPLCSPSQSGGGCCGLGRMRGGVIQRARSRPGQEGARDISAGWVKQLQGWRSDRTGSRRSRPKHWAKLTGTLSFLELYLRLSPIFFFFRFFFLRARPAGSVTSLCSCFKFTVFSKKKKCFRGSFLFMEFSPHAKTHPTVDIFCHKHRECTQKSRSCAVCGVHGRVSEADERC